MAPAHVKLYNIYRNSIVYNPQLGVKLNVSGHTAKLPFWPWIDGKWAGYVTDNEVPKQVSSLAMAQKLLMWVIIPILTPHLASDKIRVKSSLTNWVTIQITI